MDSQDFTPDNSVAYACGNPNMIENVKAILQRAGFPPEAVKQEVYWVADKD
jgi:ferredoxin/flavodoxin---NADP+ reductase